MLDVSTAEDDCAAHLTANKCLRAVARMTASLTGNMDPERSQALLYAGQSSIGTPR